MCATEIEIVYLVGVVIFSETLNGSQSTGALRAGCNDLSATATLLPCLANYHFSLFRVV